MYAPTRLFSIRRQIRLTAALLAGGGACALLSACVGNPFRAAEVNPNSPIAPEAARLANANRPYPTFASIPPMPKDVRPAPQYGREAHAILQSRADLEAQTAPETWSVTDTESFAAQAKREAGQEAAPTSSGDSAAFANTQRKRATPPPPPKQ
jgi:hypothetical protein